jgi:CBS domain-containing protein
MAQHFDPSVQPAAILEYLRTVMPFSELGEATLEELAAGARIDFKPKGYALIRQGQAAPEHAYLIQRGGVKVFFTGPDGGETLLDYRGEGHFAGVNLLFRNQPSEYAVETVEDSFFIKFPGAAFMDLAARHPAVSRFFLASFSESRMDKVFSELRGRREAGGLGGGLYLFGLSAGDMAVRAPVTASLTVSLRQAAAAMVAEGVGSLLLTDPSGETLGIITDTDLRRAMAHGMAPGAQAATIMSSPVVGIDSQANCFDALVAMMDSHIHHLTVRRGGKVVGLITAHDIMVAQGKSPMALYREIRRERDFGGLSRAAAKTVRAARALVDEGAKAGNIVRVLSILGDLIIEKTLELLHGRYGPPPLQYCFLALGGAGRGEEVLGRELACAVIYADTEDELILRAADVYFTTFMAEAARHLGLAGFTVPGGGASAADPAWRMTLRQWKELFADRVEAPHRAEIRDMRALFDFRPVYGRKELGVELREGVRELAAGPAAPVGSGELTRELARDCALARPPLSFFKTFIVEKDGEHKNTLDLTGRGLTPFVDFARALALRFGVVHTGSLERAERLAQGGHLPRDLAADFREAFEFLLTLRLVRRLEAIEAGGEPADYIDPAGLSELEKRTLKDAFAVIGRLAAHLRETFRLGEA